MAAEESSAAVLFNRPAPVGPVAASTTKNDPDAATEGGDQKKPVTARSRAGWRTAAL